MTTFTAHALSPVTTSSDSAWSFHVAASILQQGNFNLDEYRQLVNPHGDYRLRQIRGHLLYYYPTATPLLIVPVVWIVNQVYPISHPTDYYTYLAEHAPDERTSRLEKLVASGFVALATVVMYLIARRFLGIGQAAVIAFIFGFTTSMWSTASRALWQHGPSALFLTLALYITLSVSRRPWAAAIIGLILGYSYLIRPTNSLSVTILGLFFLLKRREVIGYYLLGITAVLAPFILQNLLAYGNVFPPYSYQLFERLGTPTLIAEGLIGTLFSPGRGLFVFTPVCLFSLYGAYLACTSRKDALSDADPFIASIVVAHWITTSLFEDWGGGWSIGPRYFVDVIPYLVYFLIPLFRSHLFNRQGIKTLFALSILAGFLIQLHGAISIYPYMWNGKPKAFVNAPERKWDWGDLQFLRGFCPGNPLEGRAPACWIKHSD